MFDVYVLDIFKDNSNTILYKLLIADINFARPDNYIQFCDKHDIQRLYSTSIYNFHNLTVSDVDKSIWLSKCENSPKVSPFIDKSKITLTSIQTIWEFLWDIITHNLPIAVDTNYVDSSNLLFCMSSDDIYLSNNVTYECSLIWTTPEPKNIAKLKPLRIKCSNEFYEYWNSFIGTSGLILNAENGELTWEVKLWELYCQYNNIYADCRFCDNELQYLIEKYLLLKSHLHGVELGNWLMHRLNGIDKPLYSFIKPKFKQGKSNIRFKLEASLPNAIKISKLFSENLDDFYDFIMSASSPEEIERHFIKCYDLPSNIYGSQFIKGFLTQISTDKKIILQHEFNLAERMQNDITALACRIFAYKLIKIQQLNKSCLTELHIRDGALKMEVLK